MKGTRVRATFEFSLAILLVAAGAGWFFSARLERAAPSGTALRPAPEEREAGAQTDAVPPISPFTPLAGETETERADAVRTLFPPAEKQTVQEFAERWGIRSGSGEKTAPLPAPLISPKAENAPLGQKQEALREYGNALGAPLKQTAGDGQEELAVLNKTIGVVAQETETAVASLAGRYEALAENINAVEFPKEARPVHQSLATAYAAYAEALRGFVVSTTDGKILTAAFQKYSDAALAVGKAVVEAARFFAEQGVSFAPDEPGYIFALP